MSARSRALTAARWIPGTVLLAETAVGSYWDFSRISYVRDVFDRLGYPMYFATILGAAKAAAIAALVTPGHPRTKEWAYAGLVFVYGGAAVSHIAVGDKPDKWATPLFSDAPALPAANFNTPGPR
ncbi:DoxX family protein [Nocardia sp. NPDC127526]|uniref:DoxX family protein n=1 Tax=Nocardia sp. NPDC127526 TaxID=3345393 RepID=UPI00363D1A39